MLIFFKASTHKADWPNEWLKSTNSTNEGSEFLPLATLRPVKLMTRMVSQHKLYDAQFFMKFFTCSFMPARSPK
jgi:hypothetical protein